MKTKLIILVLLLIASSLFSQNINKIGAAGISFLLNSKSGQTNLNHDEKVALSILGSFLNEQSNRQHDLDVANASATKVIYTESGNQVQLVKDTNGNVYILQDGVIHLISQSVVNMATGSNEHRDSRKYLPDYNIKQLRDIYDTSVPYTLEESYTTVNVTAPNYKTKTVYWQRQYSDVSCIKNSNSGKIYLGCGRKYFTPNIPSNTHLSISYFAKPVKLKTTFTCVWYQDINGDGVSFDENEEVSRLFYKSENTFYLVVALANREDNNITIKVSIYNESGRLVKVKRNNTSDGGERSWHQRLYTKDFSPGIYNYTVELIGNVTNKRILKERFQIIN